ncbi:MAG: indolepyruvate ferredoxin oxidoreductase subunit alpha [Candidatus Diapherotrites archaeon]|uniref:Indolepyruvate oxidoreductase subunit IorA n=1 Tax=Candidatus Iainarchaeum sp. TaxID=3101447 RepID=A0A2D6LPW1_9ARCH|nr:indolepyruvate ferredoxin oxidoreductase subunit alpha [Candidatus Diapherotrites archaeon]|tara:strand:+ start:6624 stop:8420 length:1797 start_codon:yes stop_codon:yes gene_type:complete
MDLLQKNGKAILSGNEAISRGALEAGISVATSYPGSPCTEILASIAGSAKKTGVYAEWSVNEVVAFELAAGASFANKRALCAMKNLGANTIMDFLNVVAYTGVNAGLVLIVADDPEPMSSQHAVDSRLHSIMAKIPCLEPTNGQEAKEMTKFAFEFSEKFKVPVQIRITQKIAQTSFVVELGEIKKRNSEAFFTKEPSRFVCIPKNVKVLHKKHNEKLELIEKEFDGFLFNELKIVDSELGIITSGISFNYATEALERLGVKASVLKITSTNPIPTKLIKEIFSNSKKVLVIEELEPIMEWKVREIASKTHFSGHIFGTTTKHVPRESELNVELTEKAIAGVLELNYEEIKPEEIPKRVPALCSGCSHIGFYGALKNAMQELENEFVVIGDRGCYNLAAHPPISALDTCMNMGASIPMASGFAKAGYKGNIVAVIGDSTFLHSGVQGLMNSVVNNSNITICVLDNSVTAMTGGQPHPGTGKNALEEESERVNLMEIVKASGVQFFKQVNPYDLSESEIAIKDATKYNGPAVIIFKAPCALKSKTDFNKQFEIIGETKKELGCPAIKTNKIGQRIDLEKCIGCGICAQLAAPGTIRELK